MTGRRGIVGSSLLASVGIHLGILAIIAVFWASPAHRVLEELIPVQLLRVSGEGESHEGEGKSGTPDQVPGAGAPKPLPSLQLPAPAPAERSRGALRAALTLQSPLRRQEASTTLTAPLAAQLFDDLGPGGAEDPAVLVRSAGIGGPKPVGINPALASFPGRWAAGAAGGARSGQGISAAGTGSRGEGSAARGIAGKLGGFGGGGFLSGAGGPIGRPGYGVNPKPDYPPLARERGYESVVLLKVRVLPDGSAGEIRVERSSGYDILDHAALSAVKRWTFIPARRNGIAVPAWVTVPIRFSLSS